MERVTINTGLSNFLMPDKIIKINDNSIETIKKLDIYNFDFSTKIETSAQICAMHTRFKTDFQTHAFLLKIEEFDDYSIGKDFGNYTISGKIESSVKSAALYSVNAYLNNENKFSAKLLIATTDYNETFKKQILEKHYRNIYTCLTKDLKKN